MEGGGLDDGALYVLRDLEGVWMPLEASQLTSSPLRIRANDDGAFELIECRLEVPLAVNRLIMYKDYFYSPDFVNLRLFIKHTSILLARELKHLVP